MVLIVLDRQTGLKHSKAHLWRSLLFVRAEADRQIQSMHLRGADAIILDLEDGVAALDRPEARIKLPAIVEGMFSHDLGCVVRINTDWRDVAADLDVAVRPGVDAIMVPKAERQGRLETIAEMVTELETERGMAPGEIALIALLETARGLANLSALGSLDRVAALALGSEDLALSMGRSPDRAILSNACATMAVTAAANGLAAWGLPISLARYNDAALYRSAARDAFNMGLTGALCIHPAQVPILNAAFSPSAEAYYEAALIVRKWESEERGERPVISVAGRMVDRPVVEYARRILARNPTYSQTDVENRD